ncbi:MAG: 2-amino-4-hydroxy-6-hydroxymethyldihydropteridine diphosphokinase [SAR324 cluster bacterium]|nr:2-amino-4-hydroxy-6-hydroxymethyldihydropteridine diphosphokinase [SAR324 cluster bacterium]
MNNQFEVFLGLGSNIGDRVNLLKAARQSLENLPLAHFRASAIYESEPYQGARQPPYLNQVVGGWTQLSPSKLLNACHIIEKNLGRIRKKRWESRLIDIDILFYENLVLNTEQLSIPHLDLVNRGFVLLPLAEMIPKQIDPRTNQSIETLLDHWKYHSSEPTPVLFNNISKVEKSEKAVIEYQENRNLYHQQADQKFRFDVKTLK